MPATMRAVGIRNGSGPAESLHIETVTKPAPGPRNVLVSVKAFAVNRMDLSQREGRYPVPAHASKVLGVEFSGTVAELGVDIEDEFKVGDEVFGLVHGGAYAEFVDAPVDTLMQKPKGLTWEQAASIPEAYMTAIHALYTVGGFEAGKTVLWHAGASSISIAGIQLAVLGKASSILTTAGSQEKLDFCRDKLGATHAINYKTQDFQEEAHRLTNGGGVDIIVDFVGQEYFQKNLDSCARDGCVVALGNLSGTVVSNVNIAGFVRKRLRVHGSSLRSQTIAFQKSLRDRLVQDVLPRVDEGRLKLFITATFPWEKVSDAHKLMESNATLGKIVCTI